MKLTGLLLMTHLLAPMAQAAPAYSEEVCRLRISGERVQLFRAQGDANFIIQGSSEDVDLRAAYVGLKKSAKPAGGEDLLLELVRQSDQQKSKYSDECYRGTKGHFRREMVVASMSRRAREKLKLKKGQTLKARCSWEALVPKDGCPPSLPDDERESAEADDQRE